MAKQSSFTQAMAWLHNWCGLLLGWALFAIFLTGTLAVFDKEISWWMQPEHAAAGLDPAAAADVAQQWLARQPDDGGNWNIGLPTGRSPTLTVSTGEQRRGGGAVLDPASGELVPARETVGGNYFFRFHYTLMLPRNIGIWVVGFAGMAMLVALIGGVIIHKRIFKDFFTLRPGKGQRSWLDGHNAAGVLLLPFHLMITYTGLVIFFLIYMPAAMDALYQGDRAAMMAEGRGGAVQEQGQNQGRGQGERSRGGGEERGGRRERTGQQAPAAELLPLSHFVAAGQAHYGEGMISGLSVSNPGRADARVMVRPLLGNRIELTKGESMAFSGVSGELLQAPSAQRASLTTQRVMAGLHFAQFGGYPMRWLYFVCGLVSCAMIASGLVLYTVRVRRLAAKGEGELMLRWVERLNVWMVAGLSLACVALLWINRLLPAELAERRGWEQQLFFGVWLLTLLHACLRPPLPAWREQLAVAALLCLALPLLDLASMGSAPDGIRLGLDITTAALGLALGWMAWRVGERPVRAARTRAPAAPLAEVGP